MAGLWSRAEDTASPSTRTHSRSRNRSWVGRTQEPGSWVRHTQEGRVDVALKIQAGVQKLGLRVSALFHQIAVDSWHSQVEILSCEPIAERAFADWSMKLIGSDDAPTAARRELLERYTGSSRFDPHATSGAAAFAFLREMAEMERHALTV